jgi:hypothetical protein
MFSRKPRNKNWENVQNISQKDEAMENEKKKKLEKGQLRKFNISQFEVLGGKKKKR